MKAEEYGIVLDFLSKGKSSSFKAEPLAQLVGEEYFTLLEVVPKEGVSLKAGDRVYVGKDERDKVEYIKKRITYRELTSNSVSELPKVLEGMVLRQEKKFIEFFNTCGAITIKRHRFELLPGLGKKHMLNLIKEREQQNFESFQDIEKRVHLMPNVVQTIVKRIMHEQEDEEEKHHLFTKPYPRRDEGRGFHRERRF